MSIDINILKLLENRKPKSKNEIVSSIKDVDLILGKMVTAGLLKLDLTTQEYSITKQGIEELEYWRAERQGMMMGDTQEVVIEA